MATIRVFSCEGVKELKCFDILQDVPFLAPEQDLGAEDEDDDDVVDF